MSKILYVSLNRKEVSAQLEQKVKQICDDLNAENIEANPTLIYKEKNILYGILNPTPTLRHSNSNVLLGELFGDANWEGLNRDYPDGNYAIFRSNNESIEIVSDVLGTRTVWFYKDEQVFICSTSQRAIIQFLGDFQFDDRVIPWIISSGSLGSSYCWDKRIMRLPADGTILLDKETWNLKITQKPVEFKCSNLSDREYEIKLKNTLYKTFQSLDLDFSKWVVSLSGGYDSRAILSLLNYTKKPLEKIKTVTWGDKASLKEKGSDPAVARKLAGKFHVTNKFYDTGDGSGNEDFASITDKFLRKGEGRNDQVLGYLDGFKTWKILYENQNHGVLRGDEVFGYNKIYSALIVRDFMGLSMCGDFSNLSKYKYIRSLKQKLPDYFVQKQNESLDTWRDRLFQMYRIPLIQASLADLKYPYIEQINPFLSRKIVTQVRAMPDHLRTNKFLFKKIVSPMSPKVSYATSGKSPDIFKKILYDPSTVKILREELLSPHAKALFPEEFLQEITSELRENLPQTTSKKAKFIKYLKKLIPSKIKKRIAQNTTSLHLDINKLGYRIYLICWMNRILLEDSGKFKNYSRTG